MLRLVVLAAALALASPAVAQVIQKEDDSLQQQLTGESFRIEANAFSAYADQSWRTSVTFAVTNNSGMGLYLGIALGSASIGSCNDLREVRGGIPVIRGPGRGVFVGPGGSSASRATFVPAGGRVGGSFMFLDCRAPNPGFPTAQLSMTLLLGKTQERAGVSFPVSVDAAIRQVRSQ
jgi:hypothetical protein